MSAANPNPMEKSMVSVLVVANAGGGVAVAVWCFYRLNATSLTQLTSLFLISFLFLFYFLIVLPFCLLFGGLWDYTAGYDWGD
jgi:hypothetical protein